VPETAAVTSELVPDRAALVKKKPGWAKAKPKISPHKPKAGQKAAAEAAKRAPVKHYRAGPAKGATLIERKPVVGKPGSAKPVMAKVGAARPARPMAPRPGSAKPRSGPVKRGPRS
jgi:hypothetical protein